MTDSTHNTHQASHNQYSIQDGTPQQQTAKEEGLEYWFIRHGESWYNREGRVQGQKDAKLSDLGEAQASKLARRLAHETFDTVYSSDLIRAKHTAQIALPDADIVTDRRLREIHFGVLEGQLWGDLEGDYAEMAIMRHRDMEHYRLPEGESHADVRTRLKDFLRDIPQAGKIAIFCHGGIVTNMLLSVLHMPMPQYNELRFSISNTSITRISRKSQVYRILTVNDTAHLMVDWPPAKTEHGTTNQQA